MRAEQEVFDLILGVARSDERIRAVLMEGSRANPSVSKDQYQDYDIVYFVHDIEPFYNHPEWVIAKFGEPLIMQMPAAMRPKGQSTSNGNFNYMMIFPDGVRIDLEFDKYIYSDDGGHEPGIILLDKDNGTGMVPVKASVNEAMWHIKPPSEIDFFSCCNDFWWCQNNAAKSIVRDELGYVMLQLHYVRNEMHDMIDWFIGSKRGYDLSTGKYGNYYRKLLPPDLYERYRETYSGSDYGDVWRSIDVMCDLFHELALAVADANNFTYRQHEEDGIRTYLNMVREELSALSKDLEGLKITAQFTDLCLISKNVLNLVDFYEKLFDATASEKSEYHSSVNIGGLSLTIDAADIADGDSVFSYLNCKASDNTIICFNVDDVDAEYARVLDLGATPLNEPTTHQWGARSFQFRDPDGNIINFRTISKGAK